MIFRDLKYNIMNVQNEVTYPLFKNQCFDLLAGIEISSAKGMCN